jgi:hypothetical protein
MCFSPRGVFFTVSASRGRRRKRCQARRRDSQLSLAPASSLLPIQPSALLAAAVIVMSARDRHRTRLSAMNSFSNKPRRQHHPMGLPHARVARPARTSKRGQPVLYWRAVAATLAGCALVLGALILVLYWLPHARHLHRVVSGSPVQSTSRIEEWAQEAEEDEEQKTEVRGPEAPPAVYWDRSEPLIVPRPPRPVEPPKRDQPASPAPRKPTRQKPAPPPRARTITSLSEADFRKQLHGVARVDFFGVVERLRKDIRKDVQDRLRRVDQTGRDGDQRRRLIEEAGRVQFAGKVNLAVLEEAWRQGLPIRAEPACKADHVSAVKMQVLSHAFRDNRLVASPATLPCLLFSIAGGIHRRRQGQRGAGARQQQRPC